MTARMRTVKTIIAATMMLVASVALAGCGSTPPVTVIHHYHGSYHAPARTYRQRARDTRRAPTLIRVATSGRRHSR